MLKKVFRNVVFPVANAVRVSERMRNKSENAFLNVTYHGVVEKPKLSFSPRHIDSRQFEKQLIYFKKHFTIISQSEIFTHQLQDTSRKRIAISFDDGFLNNLKIALPLLEKHKVKSTFFISSFCLEEEKKPIIWAELIAVLLYSNSKRAIEINGNSFVEGYCQALKTDIYSYIKKLPYQTRDEVLAELDDKYSLRAKLSKINEEQWKLMNKKELQELAKHPLVEIGSHAYSHYNLSELNEYDVKREIEIAKNSLENFFQKPMDMLAFPDGSYNKMVKEQAYLAGHTKLLALRYALAEDAQDGQILPRHSVASTTNFASNIFHINRAFLDKGFK